MASDMFMASIDAWFDLASQRLRGVDGNNGNNGTETPTQKIAAARASRVMAGTSVPSAPSAPTTQCRPEPKLDFAVSSVVRRFNDFKRDQEKKAHSKKFKGI